MKHRDPLLGRPSSPRATRPDAATAPLIEALLSMKTPSEMRALLDDLCTPAEIEAIADRWRVVPLLLKETPYREIHDRTGVSVTTIGRIARCLAFGAGGYRLAAERVLPKPRKATGLR
jgi:TrpR-related protein YerC/YecD